MQKAARETGHIKIDGAGFPLDKIQILSVDDLLNGKQPMLPGAATSTTFKKAQRKESKGGSYELFD